MRILVVCQHYYPESFQITDICEQMVADGHDVTALVGLPNYPSGIIPEKYKHGKNRKEVINGVKVIRCFEIARRKGIWGILLNYSSFCIAATLKTFSIKESFDIVFSYETSPVLMAYPANVYARRKKLPHFLYCADIWPECAKVMVKRETSFLFRLITMISTYIYRDADQIAVQSKSFIAYFEDVHGISGKKIVYLPQFSSSEYLSMDFTAKNEIFNFIFMGNIGMAQDVGCILNAVEKIKDKAAFRLHFVGDGSYLEEAKKIAKQKGLIDIVIFHGRKPPEEMPKYYQMADACLVTLRGGDFISRTIPLKTQGYMAAGKPIVAALEGHGMQVINEAKCGICVHSSDINALADAMFSMVTEREKLAEYGENARVYFKKHFTKEIYMAQLEQYLANLSDSRTNK